MALLPETPGRSRRRRQRARRKRSLDSTDPICEALLVTVVVGSALAIGTVHPVPLLLISALALAGGTLAALSFRRIPAPALVLAAFALFSLLQAVPLPASWVTRLSPATAGVWLGCLAPLREPQLTRFSLSLDANASLAETLKWLTYAAVFVMAMHVRSRRGTHWLAMLLFGSAALVSLITLLHGAANVQTLYAFYKPNFAVGRWNVGPLLNSNNFAGYANLGLFAGIGMLLSRRPGTPRAPALVAVAIIIVALLLSTSRAGISSALVGGGVLLVWSSRRREAPDWLRRAVPVLAILAAGVTAVVVYVASRNWAAWAPSDVERKLAVWRWSVTMTRDHPWFGVGRGAFETALPPYRLPLVNEDWTAVHSHAENFVLQWIAEWGVPVGLCAILLIVGYLVIEWYGARHERLGFALVTGLMVLMLQNLADLGLEIPAVVIAAVVALAAGGRAYPTNPRESSTADEQPNIRRAVALSVPLFALWVAAALWSRSPVELERRELSRAYHELSVNDPEERETFRALLRRAMLRHPGEAHFPLLGAVVTYRAREEGTLPWIARALELAPTNGRVHLVLAELLGAHGLTSQAMLHLRLATLYDGTLGSLAGARAAQWAPSLDLLLEAIPPSKTGAAVLAGACSKITRMELKVACFRDAVARNPDDASVQAQLADTLLTAINARTFPCNGDAAPACAQEAERTAHTIARLEPSSWRAGYIIAKIFLATGNPRAAAALLAKVCPAETNGQECAREAVTAAISSGADDAILDAADKYAARVCGNSDACAAALDWLGSTLDTSGKPSLAVAYYTKAAEADGSAARWLRVADRAANARLYALSRTALDRADHSPDATDNSRARAYAVRGRIARGLAIGSQ